MNDEIPTPRTDAESLRVAGRWNEITEPIPANAARILERENHVLRAELDALRELIAKSDLVEVDAVRSDSDSCGKPILRKAGTILRHKGYMAEVEEKTKLLQKLASNAREIHALKAKLGQG